MATKWLMCFNGIDVVSVPADILVFRRIFFRLYYIFWWGTPFGAIGTSIHGFCHSNIQSSSFIHEINSKEQYVRFQKQEESAICFWNITCCSSIQHFEESIFFSYNSFVVMNMKLFNIWFIKGSQGSGRSTICNQIAKELAKKPYNCYFSIYNCTQNKSRKVESIQKDLRNVLTKCVQRQPSLLILDNLDTLAKFVSDHSQNSEYYNQVSEAITYMISNFISENTVSVIATITSLNNLNNRIYSPRGNHIFGRVYKILDLTKVCVQ